MLLHELGHHVQLTKIDGNQQEKFIFPTNTSDDVVIDEEGTTLKNYVPSITTDLSVQGKPMGILETSSEEIIDSLLETIFNA